MGPESAGCAIGAAITLSYVLPLLLGPLVNEILMEPPESPEAVTKAQPGPLVCVNHSGRCCGHQRATGRGSTQVPSALTSTNSIPSTFLDTHSAESTLLGTWGMTLAVRRAQVSIH